MGSTKPPSFTLVLRHKPSIFKRLSAVGTQAIGVWLFSGDEQLSTVAEEVREIHRTHFPSALARFVPSLHWKQYFLLPLALSAAIDTLAGPGIQIFSRCRQGHRWRPRFSGAWGSPRSAMLRTTLI